MAAAYSFFRLLVLALLLLTVEAVQAGSRQRYELYACRVLNSNYINSQPLLEYPLIFEPITRGRLTIWSGASSLPGSEFQCYADKNGTSAIFLDFANFVDKLEWTFFDVNKGVTLNGISVNHRENVVYRINLANEQSINPFACNTVSSIEPHREEKWTNGLRTACKDCGTSVISLVNSQIKELFKLRLNNRIINGLDWHVSQLITSQHFSGPIEL